MSSQRTHVDLSLAPDDNRRLASLCGQFDQHLRQIEQRLDVEISNRGSNFQSRVKRMR